MEPLVIALAFLLGLAFRKAGYPPLLGYLLAGFTAHALGMGSEAALKPLADAGILLLLFTIGLKLNPRDLSPRYVWGSALLHMVIAIPLTTAVIYLIAMVYAPLSFAHPAGPFTLAFALSFSSTVLAIKLFEERGEMASFYASIAIGILVVQDVLAVVYLVATSGHLPSPWALALMALPFTIPLLKRLMQLMGHGELLLLSGVVFAFGAAELFVAVDLKGGLGALVMGMLLSRAHEAKSRELYDQLLGLKNLLLIGFFLQIGYYGLPQMELVYVAIVLGFLITLRPVIYFALLTAFGLRARTGWLTGLALFNYSEFGLIVAAIAQEAGVLGEKWLTTLALAMAISYVFAIPINRKAHELYVRHSDRLRRFEKPERLPEEIIGTLDGATVAILGMGRVGRGAFDALREAGHEHVIGIEENYALTLERNQAGWPCVHGDASDRDFWERTGLANCQLILVSLSNHREQVRVARLARELGFQHTLAVATRFLDEAADLEALGCLTFYRYQGVGRDFANYTLATINPDR
ncbi:MAG: cation:proton antiporter [Granulosicoccus sp.]|nr:cation:proton antiporter [Granulosicoccus sp.]